MYVSEDFATFLTVIFILSCILNIILFFKIWKMTNTVEDIFNLSLMKSGYKMIVNEGDGKSDGVLNKKKTFVKDV